MYTCIYRCMCHVRHHVKYSNTHCFPLKHVPKRGGSGALLTPFTPWWKVPCFYTVAMRFSVGSCTLRRLLQAVSSCAEIHTRTCTAGGIQIPMKHFSFLIFEYYTGPEVNDPRKLAWCGIVRQWKAPPEQKEDELKGCSCASLYTSNYSYQQNENNQLPNDSVFWNTWIRSRHFLFHV